MKRIMTKLLGIPRVVEDSQEIDKQLTYYSSLKVCKTLTGCQFYQSCYNDTQSLHPNSYPSLLG